MLEVLLKGVSALDWGDWAFVDLEVGLVLFDRIGHGVSASSRVLKILNVANVEQKFAEAGLECFIRGLGRLTLQLLSSCPALPVPVLERLPMTMTFGVALLISCSTTNAPHLTARDPSGYSIITGRRSLGFCGPQGPAG
jgi:hypothetical protein